MSVVVVGPPDGHRIRRNISAFDNGPPNERYTDDDSAITLGILEILSLCNSDMFQETKFRSIDILYAYVKAGTNTAVQPPVQPVFYAARAAAKNTGRACHFIAYKIEELCEWHTKPDAALRAMEFDILKKLACNVAFANAHQMLLASINALSSSCNAEFKDGAEKCIFVCAYDLPAIYSSKSASIIADAALLVGFYNTENRRSIARTDRRVHRELTSDLGDIIAVMHAVVSCKPSEFANVQAVRAFISKNQGWREIDKLRGVYLTEGAGAPSPTNVDDDYVIDKNNKLGSGTYGAVYKGHRKANHSVFVAVKRFERVHDQGVDYAFVTEVSTLKAIPKYRYVVDLLEVYMAPKSISVVYELANESLHDYAQKNHPQEKAVADIMFQIACGIAFIHAYGRVHRDLKPQNILVNVGGGKPSIKIADFGAGAVDPLYPRTMAHLTTIWYRAPESLCGDVMDEAIDVWAMGCIMAELIKRTALFTGQNVMDMLGLITQLLGTAELPWKRDIRDDGKTYKRADLHEYTATDISTQIGVHISPSEECVALLRRLVAYPQHRITVFEALDHPFFSKYGKSADDEPFNNNRESRAMREGSVRKRKGSAPCNDRGTCAKMEERNHLL